jgi:hypothetical protein
MAFPVAGVYYIKCVVDGIDVYANTIGPDFLLSGAVQVRYQKVCFEDYSAIFSAHAVSSGGWNISILKAKMMNEPVLCSRSSTIQSRAT